MNALLQGVTDRVTGNYYYELQLDPGIALQSQYNLFNAALSQQDPYPLLTITGPAPMLSKVETNIPAPALQGLPIPYDIVIGSIGLYIAPNTIKQDVDTLIQYGYFEFAILGKVQWDGKFDAYPSGIGLTGFTTQTTESGWTIGVPSPNDTKRFGRYGKYLAPQVMWSFTLFFPPTSGPVAAGARAAATLAPANATPTPGVGAVLRAYLFGLVDRPVL
jgi:hypothetical protein